MNRKPRQAGVSDAGPPPSVTAVSEMFNAAVAHHQAGSFAEAERLYGQILTFDPDHAELRSRLGAVLMAQGKISQAVAQLELALTLQADLFEAHASLAQAYLAVGRVEPAFDASMRALELKDTLPSRILFAQCLKLARFTADDGRIRQLALRALVEGWARPRELTGVCISLIKLNNIVNDAISRANAAWPARLSDSELLGASPITAALSQDVLLCRLLEHDPLTDIGLERLLTSARSAMLTACAAGDRCDDQQLDFFCSIARQCFINEYIYATTESEAEEARRLREALEKALTAGEPYPDLWPIVVGAYFPLHDLTNAETLLQRPWPQSVSALLARQVKEPVEERQIGATIPVLTAIDHAASELDRQYQVGASPRWVWDGLQRLPLAANPGALQPPEVLVAGCGTGLSAIEFARQATNARVFAVDPSLANLSYGKRMARNLAGPNIEFAQADIMRMGSLGQRFDFIDVSEVLDHLADPWEGLRILLSLMRAGSTMRVGVYSEQAHRAIAAARALIDQRGGQVQPSDIRRCREDLVATGDPLAKSVCQWQDFFTTGECRHLLFDVQRQRITLEEIKSFLAENGLQFGGFVADAATRDRFAARFPDPSAVTDLDSWAAFAADAPQAFPTMYQFWVHKPSDDLFGGYRL
jgi:2-polyprenyl-3-methyl-5-hydroxy-6-metoxy-1,4-benzoquinol methylase/tetratricopeptide (TPR) repeat protein